jgi:orotate phosphoribosyltransferase
MGAGLQYDKVSALFSEMAGDYKTRLRDLLARKSVTEGRVKLSSGKWSDYYIDCKLTTLDPEGAFLTGHTILEFLETNGIKADAIGGPTIGADPIVAAVATISHMQKRPLAAFLVRKEPKAHGKHKQIEGVNLEREKISRVVVIDEVCTEGKSTQDALDVVEAAGLQVVAVISLVDREEGGSESLRKKGYRYLPVFTGSELLQEHLRLKRVESDVHHHEVV